MHGCKLTADFVAIVTPKLFQINQFFFFFIYARTFFSVSFFMQLYLFPVIDGTYTKETEKKQQILFAISSTHIQYSVNKELLSRCVHIHLLILNNDD